MNSSILSSKRVKESKKNDNSKDNNKKSEKENTDPPTNEKSNFMKTLKEVSVSVLSIAMIKVITQILVFPQYRAGWFLIYFEEMFVLSDEKNGYEYF